MSIDLSRHLYLLLTTTIDNPLFLRAILQQSYCDRTSFQNQSHLATRVHQGRVPVSVRLIVPFQAYLGTLWDRYLYLSV
jgi:hypothetical protein